MTQALSILKDWIVPVVTIIVALIGSYVALTGLSTWKRQLRGQTDHELARRILIAIYKYREAVNAVRHPAMFNNEFPDPPGPERARMNDAQIRFFGFSRAYQNRWNRVQGERVELHASMLEAEAIWGPELKSEILPPMFNLEWELQVCIRNHLILSDPDEPDDRKTVIQKMSKNVRDIQYDSLEKDGDEFSKDLGKAVERVEKYLKPKLGRD